MPGHNAGIGHERKISISGPCHIVHAVWNSRRKSSALA